MTQFSNTRLKREKKDRR